MRGLARSLKRNKHKVVSGSRVTLPENFAYKPELSFHPLARVTLPILIRFRDKKFPIFIPLVLQSIRKCFKHKRVNIVKHNYNRRTKA